MFSDSSDVSHTYLVPAAAAAAAAGVPAGKHLATAPSLSVAGVWGL